MKKGYFILIILNLLLINIPVTTVAQSFPEQIQITGDGRILETGGVETKGFYDESIIRQIRLEFSDPEFWDALFEVHETDGYLIADMTIDGILYKDVGVQFKGNTSFRKVKDSVKYSFNISLDFVHEGQDIEGYNTLNLNNAYGDPTFIREVLYLHQIRNYIPAARGNFAELYLNGESWGPYSNIQQINKDFLEEWFLSNDGTRWRADKPADTTVLKAGAEAKWGKGFAALNYLGPDTTVYKYYYTLKSTEAENPWSILLRVCDILNNTPSGELEDTLSQLLDIDRTLWFLAGELAFSDDDSYVFKGEMDYYLYVEPETGRMVPLEFDGNTAMLQPNLDWSPFMNEENENYPLLNRLLSISNLRQRYLAHFRTIISESLDQTVLRDLSESYLDLTETAVLADDKKLYSTDRYYRSINQLKNYIANRGSVLSSNYEIARQGPYIDNVSFFSGKGEYIPPAGNEEANILATLQESENVNQVNLYFSNQVSGRFTKSEMLDDGNHNDNAPNDGIYGAEIPGYKAGAFVRYYVEAIAEDSAGTASFSPSGAEHDVYFYQVSPGEMVNTGIVINELLASNDQVSYDEFGEYDDWIELHNLSDQTVSLDGYQLSDRPDNLEKWLLKGLSIEPDGYLIIWVDDDDEQGNNHTNFKLSADGEQLILTNPDGTIADMVSFRTQKADVSFARYPNGTGDFILMEPTFASVNTLVSSVTEPAPRDNFLLFPNPVSDRLFIQFQDQQSHQVEARDISGRLIYSGSHSGTTYIDVSNWMPGIYLFRSGRITVKIVHH